MKGIRYTAEFKAEAIKHIIDKCGATGITGSIGIRRRD